MQSEPVVREVRKARAVYAATPRGRYDALASERRKWQRRATIARNKLAEIEADIQDLVLPHLPGGEK